MKQYCDESFGSVLLLVLCCLNKPAQVSRETSPQVDIQVAAVVRWNLFGSRH